MSIVMLAGFGTVSAYEDVEQNPELIPTNIRGTLLKHGVWLEWTKGADKYSHQQISYQNIDIEDAESHQVEKANVSYGFISYDNLQPGATYNFTIAGVKGGQAHGTGIHTGVNITVPAADARDALPLKPSRDSIHPGGFTAVPSGSKNRYTFTWTHGIDNRYRSQEIRCRPIGGQRPHVSIQNAFNEMPTAVQRISFSMKLQGVTGIDEQKYRCRALLIRPNGKPGPKSNQVTITF